MITETYNWIQSTFFGSDVPAALAQVQNEICVIGSVVLVGSLVAITVGLCRFFFRFITGAGL